MSDVREVNAAHREVWICEECGDTLYSAKAVLECAARDQREERENRRSFTRSIN